MTVKPLLGITLGSQIRVRSGAAEKFITAAKDRLNHHAILSTGGTAQWLNEKHELSVESLRPGPMGGFLDLTKKIINDELKTMILLAEPPNYDGDAPEMLSLMAHCLRSNVDLITTPRTANIWADNINSFASGLSPSEQTIAFFAHDQYKPAMLDFAKRNLKKLCSFGRFIGGSITNKIGDISYDLKQKVDTDRVLTGPAGGDILVANEIMNGKCQHLVFFVDLFAPHAHMSDILTLLRAGRIEGIDVNFILTIKSAERWIQTVSD